MDKNDLIKQLNKMEGNKIELEICFFNGLVIYQDIINAEQTDESIILKTKEIKN
jgi:hypothetical protein